MPYRNGEFDSLQDNFFAALAWKVSKFRECLRRQDLDPFTNGRVYCILRVGRILTHSVPSIDATNPQIDMRIARSWTDRYSWRIGGCRERAVCWHSARSYPKISIAV